MMRSLFAVAILGTAICSCAGDPVPSPAAPAGTPLPSTTASVAPLAPPWPASTEGLAVHVATRQFFVGRPTVIFRIRNTKLIEMQFIDGTSKVAVVDLRDARKRWLHGTWHDGTPADLREGEPPAETWLDTQFQQSTNIGIVDGAHVFAAPPMKTILQTPGETRVERGQWDTLVQLASDHFQGHVTVEGKFVKCDHREMLAVAASILASSL